jgi:dynein heavy chain
MPKGGGGGGGGASDELIQGIAEGMLARLPKKNDFYTFGLPWLVEDVAEIYPTNYEESMNTVLTQELLRYNAVISNVRTTLQQLVKAVQGVMVMSTDLELMSKSFLNGSIPGLWSGRCYPSLKPLGAFYDDFLRRLNFLQTWINQGAPSVFWLPGFYFTQSFLTGALQNYARKYKLAIDTLGWDFEVKRDAREHLTQKAADGCYVDGLFLDGAGWDAKRNVLAEQDPKVLFCPLNVMHMKPCESKGILISQTDYRCPIYKTSERKGTLSTTGHSTNFVMDIVLPSVLFSNHWTLRGVACLTSLDF